MRRQRRRGALRSAARVSAVGAAFAAHFALFACAGTAPDAVDEAPYEAVVPGPGTPDDLRACVRHPEVQRYLESIHADIMRAWKLPEDAEAGQSSRVSFRLESSGRLESVVIESGGDPEYSDPVRDAVHAAAPFAPLSGELSCLEKQWIHATFRNPVSETSEASKSRPRGDDYLRWMAFDALGGESVLLRWSERDMPLRIHLPEPPPGLFEDPDAIRAAVERGVVDWSGIAGPNVPAFEFVDEAGEADVPIVWAEEPTGDWYIAHCVYDMDLWKRRFGVSHVLVTARWEDDAAASPQDVYLTVLHEMGHALGLGGHSPDPGDVMYAAHNGELAGLSERDRATLRKLYAKPIGHRIRGARHD